MLIKRGRVVKLLQQRVDDMGFKIFDLIAYRPDFLLHRERTNIVACSTQCADDVKFCFPSVNFLRAVAIG